MVISFSSAWKGLTSLPRTGVGHIRQTLRTFWTHRPFPPLVRVDRMWWRALGGGSWCCCAPVWPAGTPSRTATSAEPRSSEHAGAGPRRLAVRAHANRADLRTGPRPGPAPDHRRPRDRATLLRLDPDGPGVKVDIPVGWLAEPSDGQGLLDLRRAERLPLHLPAARHALDRADLLQGRCHELPDRALQAAADDGNLDDFEVTDEDRRHLPGHLRRRRAPAVHHGALRQLRRCRPGLRLRRRSPAGRSTWPDSATC